MTNLQKLQIKIIEIQNQLNSLQKELNKLKTNKRWKPKYGDTYWIINDDGKTMGSYWTEKDSDIWRYSQNNCFQTSKQAEHHLECLKTKAELRALAEELNDGVEIDWEEVSQVKYSIVYDSEIYNLRQTDVRYSKHSGEVYCLTREYLDKAIERIGEQRLIDMIKEEV